MINILRSVALIFTHLMQYVASETNIKLEQQHLGIFFYNFQIMNNLPLVTETIHVRNAVTLVLTPGRSVAHDNP